MKNVKHFQSVISAHKKELESEYSIKTIGIFGSFVRGEQKKGSDVDILVEFRKPIGLFKFLDCEEYLTRILGVKVDLVSKKALKPRIGQHIMEEVIIVS